MAQKGPNLAGKDVADINFAGARLRNVFMPNAKVTGAYLVNSSIEGDFEGLKMNGVDVAPLIEAEIERMHPTLAELRASRTAAAIGDGVETIYGMWDSLCDRAAALDEPVVHERVDDEWSFNETVRHLIYATDAWFRHAALDEPNPYHAIALSHTEARGHDPGIDLDAAPSFAETMTVRRENQAAVREFVGSLTDADVDRVCEAKASTGHPQGKFKIGQSLRVILNEEYWHYTYAVRDLDALSS